MIALQISTITKEENNGEPSTAYKIEEQNLTKRELNQFYIYLRHCVRHIEQIIDEDVYGDEFNND